MKAEPTLLGTIFESFVLLDDPRGGNTRHPIGNVVFCVLVGVICGADGFVQAEHVCRLKKAFIKKYTGGDVPSHDTMARTLSLLDPHLFASAFITFMERLTGIRRKTLFNLDGKTLRGVVGTAAMKRDRSKAASQQAQIVSLFSSMRQVVVGQLRTAKSVSEAPAAQELLQLVDIEGAIVTADAMHMTYRTLEVIAERGADAVITVKANAPALDKAMRHTFRYGTPVATIVTREEERGHVAKRTYDFFRASPTGYVGIETFVRVTRTNVSHDKQQKKANVTKYASTLPLEQSETIAKCIRGRWHIENRLHYILDVTFREDRSRIRVKYAAENFSRVRHLAFNMLSLAKTSKKLSFELKRMTAAIDDRFLARVLRLTPR